MLNLAALDAPPDTSSEANGPFETTDPDHFDDYLKVNVMGGFVVARVFGAAMASEVGFVNFNSIWDRGTTSRHIRLSAKERRSIFKPAGYSVTKSALTISLDI